MILRLYGTMSKYHTFRKLGALGRHAGPWTVRTIENIILTLHDNNYVFILCNTCSVILASDDFVQNI